MQIPKQVYVNVARIATSFLFDSIKTKDKGFTLPPAPEANIDIGSLPQFNRPLPISTSYAEASITETPIKQQSEHKGVSTQDTITYQKKQIIKEMLLLEAHLQQQCKINGIACDCCEKHPIMIDGLASETAGMDGDPIYNKVSDWCNRAAPFTTPEASASGQHDSQYLEMAGELRMMRKEIMGTIVEGG